MDKNTNKFDELFNKLYNENFKNLEQLRKEDKHATIRFIVIMIIALIGFLFYRPLLYGMIIIALVSALISYLVQIIKNKTLPKNKEKTLFQVSDKYKRIYKEKIISPILNHSLLECNYLYNKGIEEEKYKICNWGRYTNYCSENKIITPILLKNGEKLILNLATVNTSLLERMNDGTRGVPTVEFQGIYGIIELPTNIKGSINMVKKSIGIFKTIKNKIELDMIEFDKYFELISDNKKITKKIFTKEVINKILDFVKENNYIMEIIIKDSILYTRFHIKDYFEPSLLNKSIEYDKLKMLYLSVNNIVNFIKDISNEIIENNS